jgi:hypothetical protein
MAYILSMHTVVETPTYLAAADKLLSDEGRAEVVKMVAANPECGAVMAGTGGFRKVRFALEGKGKSGGARVIYILRNENFPVFLITVFAKNQKPNLTKDERNKLKKRADGIFNSYKK